MKHLCILAVLFFFAHNLYSQDTTVSACLKYHRGKFIYTDSANHLVQLERKKNYQFEYIVATKVRVQSRIKWKSDCEYDLEQVSTNSRALRKFNHKISTTIITNASGDDGYEYVCGCKKDMPTEPDFMKKVKDFDSQY